MYMMGLQITEQLKTLHTPCYLYDLDLLDDTLAELKEASDQFGYHVHYAMKANVNTSVLKQISSYSFGSDCVSGAEIVKAKETGFSSEKIVFAGVGKSDDEIRTALKTDIFCFNCESIQEIEVINEIATELGKTAKIAIRLNPDVDAQTHAYITTGLNENKFGINSIQLENVMDVIRGSSHIELIGLHFHIGSQIQTMEPFKHLCIKVNSLLEWFHNRQIEIKIINVGGGLGVNYDNVEDNIVDFKTYFGVFNTFLNIKPNQEVHFELGRAIVANCGVLLSKTLYVKPGITKDFVILDAGMTELMRPALYQAKHEIQNISKQNEDIEYKYDVVGPICESSDCFGKQIALPKTERGDLFLIYTVGAYGEVMANTYNLRTLVQSYSMRNGHII